MTPGESRSLDDRQLVIRAQKGDIAAYEELVCRYQEIAYRTAQFITGDIESAKDAAQSAFIKAFYAISGFRPAGEFRPWLLRIVANEARNQARSASRHLKYELLLAERPPRDTATQSPEGAALVLLEREKVLSAVQALPERDRRVIACRYFLELSEAETAEALNCSRGTAKSRLSRALGRLRNTLEVENRDPKEDAAHE